MTYDFFLLLVPLVALIVIPYFLTRLFYRKASKPNRYGNSSVSDRNFIRSIFYTIKKFSDFQGRATRFEYWIFYLFLFALGFSVGIYEIFFGHDFIYYAVLLIQYLMIIPSLAVATRRLHDVNLSGYWQLLPFTGIGIGILLAFLTMKSQDIPSDS